MGVPFVSFPDLPLKCWVAARLCSAAYVCGEFNWRAGSILHAINVMITADVGNLVGKTGKRNPTLWLSIFGSYADE